MTKELDGMIAKLPSATRNMYVDGESFVVDGMGNHMLTAQERKRGHTRVVFNVAYEC